MLGELLELVVDALNQPAIFVIVLDLFVVGALSETSGYRFWLDKLNVKFYSAFIRA